MIQIGRWVRARLHRRLFFWFGAAIILTGFVTAVMGNIMGTGYSDSTRLREFASSQFEQVWDDPGARGELVQRVHDSFDVRVVVEDAKGNVLDATGEDCRRREYAVNVDRAGAPLGQVKICRLGGSGHHGGFLLVLFAAGLTLWTIAAIVAHRVVRPLRDLVRVTGEIGMGKLSSRVRLGRHHGGEVGELADSVNLMAERIEQQIDDQRELLAGVSHEIRTPLARLRVLAELARERGAEPKTLDGIEREVQELDDLVGQLLASSRLDFAAMDKRKLEARAIAAHALERAELEASLLTDTTGGATILGDATLLGRALANLIDNANRHGGKVEGLKLRVADGFVVFDVEDDGKGFTEDFLPRAFEAFTRSSARAEASRGGGSLGLGLTLVHRIAVAHGGAAHAENREEAGACVGFSVPLEPTSAPG